MKKKTKLLRAPSVFARSCSPLHSELSSACKHVLPFFTACREAYSHNDEQFACNLGCQSQLPFAEGRQEQVWVCRTHSVAGGGLGLPLSLLVCLFPVGGHGAQDTPALPPDLGQRPLGGCHEPGPQLHHFLMDIVPPSWWWQSCHFPGVIWQ